MGYLRATLILIMTLLPAASVAAQTPRPHIVDRRALVEMVLQQSAADEAKRQTIREVLHNEEVRDVARRAGLDVARAEAAVATLSGDELEEAARHARAVDQSLAGGADLTISTTTIIIILLVVILIIVAVD